MKYYLGIDGGSTKTSFVLVDENKNVIDRIILGPSSIDTVNIEKITEVLQDGIKHFDKPVEACFAGIGGVGEQNENVESDK